DATVAITGNFQSTEDVLGYTNDGATMGNISASYNAATGVLTLTSGGATATVGQWRAALAAVTYLDNVSSPNTATRTISFVANDGSVDSATATRTVAITAVAPSAPTIGTAVAGNAQATVSFTPSAGNGGAAITGYTVTASPGGVTASGAGSPLTITGLTNGIAYTFTVTATNTAGTSTASAASNAVTPMAPPVINSVLSASGTYGSAFTTYTITATNSPTSFSASGLPAGLSVNTTTGAVTGTPTTNGTFNVTVGATNVGGTGSATWVVTIAKRPLGVTGATVSNKVYDATASASLNVGSAALQGSIVSGDDVVLDTSSAAAVFTSAVAGTGKTLVISGFALTGASAANYVLTQPSLTADITAKPLTLTGVSAVDRAYDATATATLAGTAALQSSESAGFGAAADGKPYAGDDVTLGGTASAVFADKNVGNAKPITVSGYTLGGLQAANYTLTQPTGLTAAITTKSLTVSGVTATDKVYDATTTANLSGSGALQAAETAGSGTGADGKPYTGDVVTLGGTMSGAFANANAGTTKTVTVSGLTLSGADAANYVVSALTATASITAKPLTISGITASGRVYDGTLVALLSGTPVLTATEAPGTGSATDGFPYVGDTVTIGGTAAGTFADRHVATAKPITVTGVTLTGAQAANYAAVQPTGLTADVTAKALTVAGLAATGKVYDATTVASLTGTAVIPTAEAVGAGTTTDGAPYTGDAVSLTGTAAGAFASKDVANAIGVTVSGLSLTGADAADYSVTAPSGLTANITPKTLVASGLVAAGKVYDGTTVATLSGIESMPSADAPGAGTALDGAPYTGDVVTLSGVASGAFADKNVGSAKSVSVAGLALSGAQAVDYALTINATSASITAKALNVTGLTAADKVYDATVGATINGTAALPVSESAGSGTASDGKPY
ncbi:MAG: beta strand repeat-containing protein, partial [Gaiellaceae bacterium]